MPLADENAGLAKSAIEGANKTFANADALYSEATILANGGAWARALFLHQIALEECAKIEMIGAAPGPAAAQHVQRWVRFVRRDWTEFFVAEHCTQCLSKIPLPAFRRDTCN